jgi:hypothetical protein
MAKTIVEGTRRGVDARPGWTPWQGPQRVTVVAVEPRGAAAESLDAGGSTRDGASASDIDKSRRWWREPAMTVEHRGVAVVQPRGAAVESPDAGGSARDGASEGHGDRGNRRGRWSTVGWRRWNRVGRLLNHWMWEDLLRMFRVTIIG